MSNLDELAAALDKNQVTDDEGQIVGEETSQEESAPQEQTPVEEAATAEKSADTEDTSPEESTESENEPEMVETAADETGKRYVPESRFKEVYAKMKAFERKLTSKTEAEPKGVIPEPKFKAEPLEKADAVEIELLRATLPQFNPESEEYSREMDELGFAVYKATPGITRIEAARRAVQMAKKIQSKVAKVNEEARSVKSEQSDQGITSRVTSRADVSNIPGEDASPDEMEAWLKAHGQW